MSMQGYWPEHTYWRLKQPKLQSLADLQLATARRRHE